MIRAILQVWPTTMRKDDRGFFVVIIGDPQQQTIEIHVTF